MSDGLVAFLRARLDDDEVAARAWQGRRCDGCGRAVAARGLYGLVKCLACEPGELPMQPARPLRDVAAKREIIKMYDAHASAEFPDWEGGCASCIEDALRELAAVYSDHPDYRQEFKPWEP